MRLFIHLFICSDATESSEKRFSRTSEHLTFINFCSYHLVWWLLLSHMLCYEMTDAIYMSRYKDIDKSDIKMILSHTCDILKTFWCYYIITIIAYQCNICCAAVLQYWRPCHDSFEISPLVMCLCPRHSDSAGLPRR